MHHLFLLLALLSPQLAAAGDSCGRHHCCAKHSSKYRSGSANDANLRRLEATFPAAVASSPHLSAQTTVGGPLAKGVVGFAFCRPGMGSSSSRACLARAFRDAKGRCPCGKDAAVDYGDTCVLHYYEDDPRLALRKVHFSTGHKGRMNSSVDVGQSRFSLLAFVKLEAAGLCCVLLFILGTGLLGCRKRRMASAMSVPGRPED